MDLLAREPVTDWLSIGAGYVTGCVILVTLGLPVITMLKAFKLRVSVPLIIVLLLIASVPAVVVMVQAHTALNAYQAWYTAPMGPPLDLSVGAPGG